jgi:hypothetical protein
MTLVRAAARGVIAGASGTAAMDALWYPATTVAAGDLAAIGDIGGSRKLVRRLTVAHQQHSGRETKFPP